MPTASCPKLALAAMAVLTLAAAPAPPRSPQQILDAAAPSEWRRVDPAHTLYLDLKSGRVVIELAPGFAPKHAANIEALVRAGYFDHAYVVRSQDNFVVQWSQPDAAKPMGAGRKTLEAEFDQPIDPAIAFDRLPDPDTYAPEVGFAWGMPAARDLKLGRMWLAHCYGMVGAGRDNAPESGPGTELYAVDGEAPRQLDRNVALVGRVIVGMEQLSSAPRGTGDMGFYKTDAERLPIERVRLAADVPAGERVEYEALRTDSLSFRALVESRRNRQDAWYRVPAGAIGLCSVPLPVRAVK
jgi:peptidylprolyl isomerase